MNYGTAVAAIRPARKIRSRRTKKAKMKLSVRQKIRNWLLADDEPAEIDYDHIREVPCIESEGMRLTVYKASGGFVIETRTYDRRKDESINKMYVITESQDLGNELGKIITMETLR